MKTLITLIYTFLILATSAAFAKPPILQVRMDLTESEAGLQSYFARTLAGQTENSQVIFEFTAPGATTWGDTTPAAYKKNYPNGDFYYFIGGLSNPWSQDDYARFYKTAKWLSLNGFRTIINVRAFIADVKEAVTNPNTAAIIWNSHGSNDGVVYDSAEESLPENLFRSQRSSRLKYILFSNCYGSISLDHYKVNEGTGVEAFAWEGEVDSDMMFRYLASKNFKADLEEALNITLQ